MKVAHFLQGLHTFWLDTLMGSVSELGFNPLAGCFVGLTIVFIFLVGLKWESTMLLLAALGARSFELIIKNVVQRQRPAPKMVDVVDLLSGYSFPSGHVLLFTAFLGFLMFLVYTLTWKSWLRWVVLGLLAALIALVGVSRVYLGQHWPSDVIGAYLLGSLWLTLTIYIYRRGKTRFFVRQPLAAEKPVSAA